MNDRYPHTCRACRSSAYRGLGPAKCSNRACEYAENPHNGNGRTDDDSAGLGGEVITTLGALDRPENKRLSAPMAPCDGCEVSTTLVALDGFGPLWCVACAATRRARCTAGATPPRSRATANSPADTAGTNAIKYQQKMSIDEIQRWTVLSAGDAYKNLRDVLDKFDPFL